MSLLNDSELGGLARFRSLKLLPQACLLTALLFAHAGWGQQLATVVPDRNKTLGMVRTSTPPTIDGVLDERVWSTAAVIENDDLHQYLPVDHGRPSERTEFYLLYDDDYLYFGARLWDSEPARISAREMVQGQSLEFDDAVAVYLDPFNNNRTGYVFQANPNGVRVEGVFETTTEINYDWRGIWQAEAQIDDEGWTAEIAIPFKTLNFDASNSNWGLTLTRTIARKTEEIAWTSYNRTVDPSTTGIVTGMTGVQQGRGLDIIPSLVATESKRFADGSTDSELDPALDIFYKFTPSLTGVLTLNTDFSATEVDDRQVNLTRFNLFFPEKRDFFLQDVDIFSFGGIEQNGIPFFSRKIGLSPDGQAVDLDVGAKLTGRAGRWNIGALGVEQDGFGSVEPSSLFVGRAAANVLEESSVGFIVTDGDPTSNLDNSLLGVDFRYRNTNLPSGITLQGTAWYQQSDTEGITTDDSAWGLSFESPNSEGLSSRFEYEVIEENFNPALGFVNRPGIERTDVRLEYVTRPEHPWMRSISHVVWYSNFDTTAGDLETRRLWTQPIAIENHIGDEFGVQLVRQREILIEPFEISDGIVIAPGDYSFNRYEIEAVGANERTFAPGVEAEFGDFFDGKRLVVEAEVQWRPSSQLFLGLAYELNDIDLPAGDFTTRVIQVRANYAFNNRWSWVNLLQYDNVSSSAGINSRLRWNPRAGEDLYIVLNHDFDATGSFSGLRSQNSLFTVKYTRTFRL